MNLDKIKKEEVKQLMNLFSFFAPNNIHCSWFSEASKQLSKYPLLQEKIKNEDEYMAILKELEKHSLIELKDDKISIDPSTQESVRNAIAKKDEYVNTCINIMNALIFYDFSTRESGENFYDMEQSIKSILAHNKEETPEVANLYIFLGFGFDELDDYSQASEYSDKALNINEKVFIKDTKNKASKHNNMARIYDNKGNYELALKYCYKALNIREEKFGKDSKYIATVYNSMSRIYNHNGKYELALEYGKKALNIREEKLGKEHSYTAAVYNNLAKIYENQGNYSEAVEYYKKAGIKNILKILVCFKKENREEVIKQGLLNDLSDVYFDEIIKQENLNQSYKKEYKAAYIKSIYIISLLHINYEYEEEVAYYTKKELADKMLIKDSKHEPISKFRLNSINYSNDPKEGSVLLDFLFEKEIEINQFENPYRAFAGCFTFNHDSLNQFRLYGKEEDKECTGVSIVFKKGFFEKSAKLATDIQDDTQPKEEYKQALYRCIYIDPKTEFVSVGHKEEFLFYKDGKLCDIDNYNKKIQELRKYISDGLKDLKKFIEEGIKKEKSDENKYINVISKLLINLRYLTKHVAFKEEQECRIIDIKNVKNKEVRTSENKKQMYLEYLEIGQHVEKVYFAPNASSMNVFQDRLLNDGKKIKCIKSKNPFAL